MHTYGRLISILHRKAQVYMSEALHTYGLTAAEQPFLNALYHQDKVTQDQLSEHLKIDKAATARTVQSLVNKGFVEKYKHDDDRRCNTICLTEKGKKSRAYLMPILDGWSELITADLDEQTREIVYHALESMVEKVGYLHR